MVPDGIKGRRTRMGKGGAFHVEGHYTRIWEGESRWFDYLD